MKMWAWPPMNLGEQWVPIAVAGTGDEAEGAAGGVAGHC